jgi:hypothetical protein
MPVMVAGPLPAVKTSRTGSSRLPMPSGWISIWGRLPDDPDGQVCAVQLVGDLAGLLLDLPQRLGSVRALAAGQKPATSSHRTAALTAARALGPTVNRP